MSLAYSGFSFLSLVDILNGIVSSKDSSRVVDEVFLLPKVDKKINLEKWY